MGGSNLDRQAYTAGVNRLQSTGKTFARSQQAAQTGIHSAGIAEILDPRLLKDGVRESCFADGFDDVTPIVVSIDGTASMGQVPHHLLEHLPGLIEMITEKQISDHPNVLFMCHDDEHVITDAKFQMSQFEIGADELISALNEMIIPGCGGGNMGEAYHLPIYAAANHTRLESFERDERKGFFFLIGDEEPYYEAGDPMVRGTSPEIAQEVFGDSIEAEVSMLVSLKKLSERYHVFVIRPGHTQNGKDRAITRLWQGLLEAAGLNPEHVLEIEETDDIIPSIAMAIGRLAGVDADDLVDVLQSRGVNPGKAAAATSALVPAADAVPATTGEASTAVATSDTPASGRSR